MTNEQKAAVERAAKNLIKGLKTKVSHCDSDDNDVSWGMQEGILISKGDAKAIIELMESHTAALLERVKELEEAMNRIMEISITDTGRILSQSYGIAKEALKHEVNND